MTIIDLLWAQTERNVFITRAEFERRLEGWTIEPVEIDGEIAFAKVHNGPEFHYASFGYKKPITKRMVREWLAPIIENYGYVMVRTPRNDIRQRRFNRLIGFVEIGEDEFFIHAKLENLRCQ